MAEMHVFSTEAASKVGVNAAALLHDIAFWCRRNAVNGENIHDGKAWTYNSLDAWAAMYPYLSKKQIRLALSKLIEGGYIVDGDWNQNRFDRTKWYALTDAGWEISGVDFKEIDVPEKAQQTCPPGHVRNAPEGTSYIRTEKNQNRTRSNTPIAPYDDSDVLDSESDDFADFAAQCLAAYNEEAGQQVGYPSEKAWLGMRRIFDAGRTLDDVRQVVRKKRMQWQGDERMRRFIRPETLLGDKFESYLNEPGEEAIEDEFSQYDRICHAAS